MKIIDIPSLLEAISKLESSYPDKVLYFRGQQKSFEKITPSIDRENFINNEDYLLKDV